MRVLKNTLFTIIKMVLLFVVVYSVTYWELKNGLREETKTLLSVCILGIYFGTRFLRRR